MAQVILIVDWLLLTCLQAKEMGHILLTVLHLLPNIVYSPFVGVKGNRFHYWTYVLTFSFGDVSANGYALRWDFLRSQGHRVEG